MEELNDALSKVKAREKELCALVITAEGDKAFSAGVEVATQPADKVDSDDRGVPPDLPQPRQPRHPDVAAVKGAALGGGCEVALFCDMVVPPTTSRSASPR